MYYFGLLAHFKGSVTQLLSSETVKETAAIFSHIATTTYTTNDDRSQLIKWPSKNFPEMSCLDKEIVIYGFNLQPDNSC